eukprot:GHRR01021191.1.p1 GENE.GHRR01021191.1~~GHRR01021191.1.p1  ORF type:complete len:226 (+),score=47.44 GHRR01021191.1:919-1596(+)
MSGLPGHAGQGLHPGLQGSLQSLHRPVHGLTNIHPRSSSLAGRSVRCRAAMQEAQPCSSLQLQAHVALPSLQWVPICIRQQHLISQCSRQQHLRRPLVTFASKDNSSGSSTSSNSNDDPSRRRPNSSRSSWLFAWLQRISAGFKPLQPSRLLLNVLMLMFLMRLWPVGGRLGMAESETLVVHVPFSEFIRRVKHDDVRSVAVDGLHISFSLKPGSLELSGEQQME